MLQGAFDLHMHVSPDILPRKLTDLQAARDAAAAGMRAIMTKNHVTPTYARAAVANEAVPGVAVYGGVVLNKAVGGINPAAVDAACAMGAKCVWMPTISSGAHIRHFKGDPSDLVQAFIDGKPVPGLMEILERIARADIILATGHLAPEESVLLVDLAIGMGVKKIVITHPEFEAMPMSIDMQKQLTRKGVFFERCFYATNSPQKLPVEAVAEAIKLVGADTTVISSDFGQAYNVPPVEGLAFFLKELARCGVPEKDLRRMITDHPASLLNM